MGPTHKVTYPLGYWKAGIKALANKNILLLSVSHGFAKDIIIKFVAIKKGEFHSELIRLAVYFLSPSVAWF